jgi:zinc transporter ZupT
MVLANLSLVAGLLLWVFVHPAGQIQRNWLDAVCGFLLGVSIAVNLLNLWSSSRCRNTEPEKL